MTSNLALPPPASSRGPLPFGLGREARCSISSCQQPGVPLPVPGTQLHDQVAQALSTLFSTFFATSLRYLGVSEILDWLHVNATVDAWLLTGFEQGRTPTEVAEELNLLVGRGAIKSVILAALNQDDEAWATSLREVGFSSGMSMAYEGIISQLKYNKSSPIPCLHTLITPTGLSMLKSAPLKHAFPVCPPRDPPSPQALLASIRSLISSGALSGPAWKQASVWRPQVRRAFAAYHAMCKEVAEEVVSDPSFSNEYQIFLDSISQPLQLLQLIAEDFDECFGPGACKGLLGVGDVGGQNLIQIMDFCAAKRPSELLARVKARVAEKQEREKILALLDKKRARLLEIETEELRWADVDIALGTREADKQTHGRATIIQPRNALRKERATLEAAIQTLCAKEKEMIAAREKEKAARNAAADALANGVPDAAAKALGLVTRPREVIDEVIARQGSSKDLFFPTSNDPFSATAPRAVSPSAQSAKGKAKAVLPPPSSRSPARYGPRGSAVPSLPLRSMSPLLIKPNKSRSSSPVATLKANHAAAAASLHTPPPSPPRLASPTPSHDAISHRPLSKSEHAPRLVAVDDYEHEGEHGCAACAATLLDATMAPVLAQRSLSASTSGSTVTATPSVSIGDEGSVEATPEGKEEAAAPVPLTTLTPSSSSSTKSKKKKKKASAASKLSSVATTTPAEAPPANASTPPTVTPSKVPPVVNADLVAVLPEGTIGLLPALRPHVPKCCSPDRCTGDSPNFSLWPQLDMLLVEVCLSGFKYELIDNLAAPLEAIRDRFAKRYLLAGGKMVDPDGHPKEMDATLRQMTDPKLGMASMWSCLAQEDVQAYTQRVLAVSLRKLMDVFKAQLGDLCACRLSNHPEVLATAHQRLTECETADRQIPIELPAMNQQEFMKWAHTQLREGKLGGPEWHGTERQYRVADFLLAWSDGFDAALDRLIARQAYALAEDLTTMIEWLGGVRMLDLAMRLSRDGTPRSQTDARLTLQEALEVPEAKRPLREWDRAIKLGLQQVNQGKRLSKEVAEEQKQIGNAHFANSEWAESLTCFATASLIHPSDSTYWTNAAAARIKLGTRAHYSEAVSDCTFALALDPKCVKALYRRGNALAMLGMWDRAVADLTELVRVCPTDPSREALAWVQARRAEHGGGGAKKEK